MKFFIITIITALLITYMWVDHNKAMAACEQHNSPETCQYALGK